MTVGYKVCLLMRFVFCREAISTQDLWGFLLFPCIQNTLEAGLFSALRFGIGDTYCFESEPFIIHILPSTIFIPFLYTENHLCGLVVRVPGYRFRSPGLIPGATRFSDK
jgi:hypothetical protein